MISFPQVFRRLFFPGRRAEDGHAPDRRNLSESAEPATSSQEVLERAVAVREEAARAPEPADTRRVSEDRAVRRRKRSDWRAIRGGSP